jgi:uncharacterized membrane protein YidH (DUF202 family)
MGKGPELYDRAAQLERTALAWNRASVAVVANGALLLRAGLVYDHVFVTAAGLAASVIGLVLWMLSTTQYSALAGRRAVHLLAGRPEAVRILTVFVAVVSLVALVATLIR